MMSEDGKKAPEPVERVDNRLQVQFRNAGEGIVVFRLEGEIDILTTARLKSAIQEQIDAGHHHLIFELHRVGYIDSSGMGALIGALRRVQEHQGSVSLVAPQPAVKKLLGIARLDKVMKIYPTTESAVRAARPRV